MRAIMILKTSALLLAGIVLLSPCYGDEVRPAKATRPAPAKPAAPATAKPPAHKATTPARPSVTKTSFESSSHQSNETSVDRKGDRFTVRHKKNDVTMLVNGQMERGKAKLEYAIIRIGTEQARKYLLVQQVPEKLRATVQTLLREGEQP